MTYGDIRFRLAQQFPGLTDLLDGWIADRYAAILDRLDWDRRRVQSTLETTAAQAVYALPADCKILEGIRSPQTGRPLDRVSRERLNEMDAARAATGHPTHYAPYMEDESDPPRMQVELWPTPDAEVDLPLEYIEEAPSLSATSVTMLPWVRPAALIAGVSADACLHLAKEQPGMLVLVDRYERRFESAVADMERTACLEQPSEQIRMADRFTRHRARRWTR